MRLNTFKIKLLILLEFVILIIVVLIVCSHCSSSEFKPVKNTEEPRKVSADAADVMNAADDADAVFTSDQQELRTETADDIEIPETAENDQEIVFTDNNGETAETDDTVDDTVDDAVDNAADTTVNNDLLQYRVARDGALGIDYPIVSEYGPREALIEGMSTDHKGIDFSMPLYTELVAPYDVYVVRAGYNESRGNWVIMYWEDGYYILYQHMSEVDVWEGEYLSAGDRVGFSGETGISVIPHLHLEILKSYDGRNSVFDFEDKQLRVDPYYFIFDNDSYTSIW